MNVGVRYLAQLKLAAGRSAEMVDVPEESTVGECVALLARRHAGLAGMLLAAGGLQPTVLTFVGDEQAGRDRVLREGDELTLLTPIAGGA